MARVRTKLPMMSAIIGSVKEVRSNCGVAAPTSTAKTAPSSAVTGMGIASVIQKITTSAMMAESLCA